MKQQKPELGQIEYTLKTLPPQKKKKKSYKQEPKALVHKWAKGMKRIFTKEFQKANKHENGLVNIITKEMVMKKKRYQIYLDN